MHRSAVRGALAALGLAACTLASAEASPTLFTYQGHLTDPQGIPLTGSYDLRFELHGTASDPGPLLGVTELNAVAVQNGLFTVTLDFEEAFSGNERRWLDISVRESGGGEPFEKLIPRQELTSTPYAHSLRLPFFAAESVPGEPPVGERTLFTLINTSNGQAADFRGAGKRVVTVGRFVDPVEPGFAPEQFAATGAGDTFAAVSEAVGQAPGRFPTAQAPDTIASANSGLFGYAAGAGFGVFGMVGSDGVGLYGRAGLDAASLAGFFEGNVRIEGDLEVTGSKLFRIDHPLDPDGKDLQHACVESDEILTLYRGTVRLDAGGRGTVTLPEWVEVLNGEFNYQLTPIGAPAPNLHVAAEVRDGRFEVAGGVPGSRVSWSLAGVRADPATLRHPLQVEVEKRRGVWAEPEAGASGGRADAPPAGTER